MRLDGFDCLCLNISTHFFHATFHKNSSKFTFYKRASSCPSTPYGTCGVEKEGTGLHRLCLFQFDVIGHQMFSMPLFHVFLQSAVHAERHLANVTTIDLLTKLAMRLHVAR